MNTNRITVHHEADRVILDLGCRRQVLKLRPLAAQKLADVLSESALRAEAYPVQTIENPKVWDIDVFSHEGCVTVFFRPPGGVTCDRVSMPANAAQHLAKLLSRSAEWAGYKLRLAHPGAGVHRPQLRPGYLPLN